MPQTSGAGVEVNHVPVVQAAEFDITEPAGNRVGITTATTVLPNPLAARGERQLLEFESAMDRQLRRVWVSVVSNELFAVETAEMLERRTN
ncbi:MAG: hypothetical protein NTW75_09005, partial [Planctomycetales bacterium]|nr:hypothetical protein [Planctomycetales bacterium]